MNKNIITILVALLFAFSIPSIVAAQTANGKTPAASGNAKTKKNADKKAQDKAKADSKTADTEDEFREIFNQFSKAYFNEQYASALVYCEQAMNKIPPSMMDDREDLVVKLYMLCLSLYDKNGQYETALKMASMIRTASDNNDVREDLCFREAVVLTKLQRLSEAREKYHKECPGNDLKGKAIVKSNIAESYMIEGDCSKAVDAYWESILKDTDNPHARYGLAVAHSRLEQWDEARQAFMEGLKIDPEFKFLDDAFFVPDCENDYQTGFRMYELGRLKEAIFYLERYVKTEERVPYRQHGQRFLERIAAEENALEGEWPVLLRNVTTMAVDSSGKKFVFASLEPDSSNEFRTDVYILDGVTNKTVRRAQLPGQKLVSSAFLSNGGARLLGPTMRYELMPENTGGYFLYRNDASCYPVSLMPGGNEFLCVRPNGTLAHTEWLNTDKRTNLLTIPRSVTRVVADVQYSTVFAQTPLSMLTTTVKKDDFEEVLDRFRVTAMDVHPTKKMFAMGIPSGTVLVNENGQVVAIFGSSQPVERVAFDPSGKHLAVLSGHSVQVWRVPELEGK